MLGQSYSIGWSKVAAGGTSSNGQYSVSGTIGQPDAGATMTDGKYSLNGGFWSLIAAVHPPGAPTLNITRSGNSVIVSWPSLSGLQQNSNLANIVSGNVFAWPRPRGPRVPSVELLRLGPV